MRYYFFTCVEQLDIAAVQLAIDDAWHARFAVILCDNALELMLHKQAEEAVQRNRLFHAFAKYQVDKLKLSEALGRHFDKKVSFSHRELRRLSDEEAQFAKLAHGYRNELYHTGIAHDRILYPLAWHYHRLVCDLFSRLPLLGYSWSPTDPVSEVVRRHVGDRPFAHGNPFNVAAASLHQARPSEEPNLQRALSLALMSRLREIGPYINELTIHDPVLRFIERARAIESCPVSANALQRYTTLQHEIDKVEAKSRLESSNWPR
ncbi:MAG: hypothetical protein AABO58_17630 [Acidobacteriota bacterium]